jgi:predicted enzyme related to lactoylglutathione lyase
MADTNNQGRYIWHELMTPDTTSAGKFYSAVVGWTVEPWKSDGAGFEYWSFMDGQRPAAGMMPVPEAMAGAPAAWIAYVEVDDVDTTVDQALSLGATVLAPARTMPGVGRFAALRDPQGAAFAAITSERKPEPETEPKPLEFSWHELATDDWKAAEAFYSALFGWKKQSEFEMGTYYMYGRDRFTYGGMMNRTPGMPPARWTHYAAVPDADAAAERVKQAGGTVIMGPMDVPGGDRIAMLLDPQGAVFAVHSKAAQ